MRTATIPAERPLSALDVIFGRRSVCSYAAQPLEASTVRALLDAAVQANGDGEQPWRFLVADVKAMLRIPADVHAVASTSSACRRERRRPSHGASRK